MTNQPLTPAGDCHWEYDAETAPPVDVECPPLTAQEENEQAMSAEPLNDG